MAAKNKRQGRRDQSPRAFDFQDVFGLHFQASRRVDELLEEVQQLKAEGKIHEAHAALQQAERIKDGIRALEREVRPLSPASAGTAK
jgi:soluble cytochrome b562